MSIRFDSRPGYGWGGGLLWGRFFVFFTL